MTSKARITRLIGNVAPRCIEPAATRLIRIASVAKATDEIASRGEHGKSLEFRQAFMFGTRSGQWSANQGSFGPIHATRQPTLWYVCCFSGFKYALFDTTKG